MYRQESDQEKIERLEKLDRRNRERSQKYLNKIKASGKKQISAFLDADSYNELCRRRDKTGLSFGDIIAKALLPEAKKPEAVNTIATKDDTTESVNIDVKDDVIKNNNIDTEETQVELPIAETDRDGFLISVKEKYPGPKNSQKRADVLNAAKIPIKGEFSPGLWTPKKANDNIRFAIKRLAKKHQK